MAKSCPSKTLIVSKAAVVDVMVPSISDKSVLTDQRTFLFHDSRKRSSRKRYLSKKALEGLESYSTSFLKAPRKASSISNRKTRRKMPVRSSPKIQAQARKCHQTLRESAKIRAQEAQITARCEWANRGYPVIQWEQLEDRLDSCNETIHCALENDIRCEDHLEHDSQSYWQRITQQISQASAGYYGPRGVDIISDHVAYKYASKIRAVAASHCLISTIGVPAFILTKLVPIAAVWMIAEDMHVDKRQAWCIFKDSKELGEILNNNE